MDGTYTAEFLPPAESDGQQPAQFTWNTRSVCDQNNRCAATARFVTPPTGPQFRDQLVFDLVDGQWLSVQEHPGVCDRGAEGKFEGSEWSIIALREGPDGTLTGTYRKAVSAGGCTIEQPITLTRSTQPQRTSGLTDPATLDPRIASPAEALRGQYIRSQTVSDSDEALTPTTFSGDTHCLRTGDRCLTFMSAADKLGLMVMVFADGRWVETLPASAATCEAGGGRVTSEIVYPLAGPVQNPIAVLKGNLRQTFFGDCSGERDYAVRLERTG